MACHGSEGNAVCLIIAQIMVHLAKCEWPQLWPTMISELINLGRSGVRIRFILNCFPQALQSIIVFDIFRRLSEDILYFQDVPTARRRELCTTLSDNVTEIIGFALDSILLAVESQKISVWLACGGYHFHRKPVSTINTVELSTPRSFSCPPF